VANDGKKPLAESIEDLKKLLKKQEKSLNLKAALMTKKTIEAFEARLKGEKPCRK
jgi:hypothetical protein